MNKTNTINFSNFIGTLEQRRINEWQENFGSDLKTKARDRLIEIRKKELKELEEKSPYCRIMAPFNFTEKIKWKDKNAGVYIIFHKKMGKCLVVGQSGNLCNRRTRYKAVYLKGGEALSHGNSTSDCQAARKMYEYDKTGLENFVYCYIPEDHEGLRLEMEKELQLMLKPLCTTDHMSGK